VAEDKYLGSNAINVSSQLTRFRITQRIEIGICESSSIDNGFFGDPILERASIKHQILSQNSTHVAKYDIQEFCSKAVLYYLPFIDSIE
jgi:hypothetical protein